MLWYPPGVENPCLQEQLITCLGNKRSLLPFIADGVVEVRRRLGGRELYAADLFAGSGVVARYLRQNSRRLLVNDLERYSEVLSRCYLSSRAERHTAGIADHWQALTRQLDADEARGELREGIIAANYAPRDDQQIQPGERVFYTRRNACYIDTARQYIAALPEAVQPFLLAPLLVEASIHANTAGVFKGFYKDRRTGVGRFGGSGGDALGRITGPIRIPLPVFCEGDCPVDLRRGDANAVAGELARGPSRRQDGRLDLVYLDPPYNQHPYGSNYFMLNMIARYRLSDTISTVSGIHTDWNRSDYNSARRAPGAFTDLVRDLHAAGTRFLLVSFNSEGFLSRDALMEILEEVGSVEVMEQRYNTFRGSRNLRNRASHVKEYLFLVACSEGERRG